MRVVFPVLLLLGLVVSARPATAQSPSGPTLNLTFGVYQSDKATEMYKKFLPTLEALMQDLESRLHRPVDIELRIFKTYDEGLEALVRGTVDFARFGPASYIIAKARNPNIRLLAMEAKKGKKRFKGLIVARRESPIQTLADLKGKRFAFGNRNSTIGRYLAQASLLRAGISARDLGHYAYLGRHDKVAKAVLLGDYDAGALKNGTFKKLRRKKELRIIVAFDNVTKPWITRAGFDPDVYGAIKAALLTMKNPRALKSLKASGFLPTTDKEYEIIRKAMNEAKGFEDYAR